MSATRLLGLGVLLATLGSGAALYLTLGTPPTPPLAPPQPVKIVEPLTPTKPEPAKPAEKPALIPVAKSAAPKPAVAKSAALPVSEVVGRIDAHFASYWKKQNVTPVAAATDAEFLRRATLDVTGKIPTAGEAREFLADPSPEKRPELIRRLIRQARFSSHLAVTLRDALLAGAATDPQKAQFVPGFEAWLRLRLADDVSYDRLAREILLAAVDANQDPLQRRQQTAGPEAFTLVHENKPELLAGSAARALLGVQVQCAECHNHPFAEWKQEQFWSLAAFFATGAPNAADVGIVIPLKKKTVPAQFLDGTKPQWNGSADPKAKRAALADWIVANPLFAKAAVNRVWRHFLGVGIVDPVDDFGPDHPASHPEVLDLLAEQFRLSGYDFKYLAEIVASTKVYGLSSVAPAAGASEPIHFARMPVRSLSPEQLFDSIDRSANGRTSAKAPTPAPNPLVMMANSERSQFLQKFWEPGERTAARGSILHALALMNGNVLRVACDPDAGPQLRAILDSPFLDDAGKLETMFLATLSRTPTETERTGALALLRKATDDRSKKQAFADVYWALLNTAEFASTP